MPAKYEIGSYADSLQGYIQRAALIPNLEIEEERAYAQRAFAHGDQQAIEALVNSHLKLVVKLARKNKGYGTPMSELIGAGNVGLAIAARRYNPGHQAKNGQIARFGTFAAWWIMAEINDLVMQDRSLLKTGTTSAAKMLFFKLPGLVSQVLSPEDLMQQKGELSDANVDAIIAKIKEGKAKQIPTPKQVKEMYVRMLGELALDAPVKADTEMTHLDYLPSNEPSQFDNVSDPEEASIRSQWLRAALKTLSAREARIFTARRLQEKPATLAELAEEFDISRERIRQIEIRAFEKVQKDMVRQQTRSDPEGKALVQTDNTSASAPSAPKSRKPRGRTPAAEATA